MVQILSHVKLNFGFSIQKQSPPSTLPRALIGWKMDRSPKGRRGKVHLWAAFKDNSVIHFGTVWNKPVFSVGFGNAGFWMNCGCYCCLAKPTVMLQIRCESLTPCLYQRGSSHSEWEIMNKCDWLFLISVVANYRSNRNCFAALWRS